MEEQKHEVNGSHETVVVQISPEVKKKQEMARKLRMLFSPPEMLDENGNINQQYFRPSRQLFNQQAVESLRWSEAQDLALLAGILQYGVHDWSSIILEYLPNWVSLKDLSS